MIMIKSDARKRILSSCELETLPKVLTEFLKSADSEEALIIKRWLIHEARLTLEEYERHSPNDSRLRYAVEVAERVFDKPMFLDELRSVLQFTHSSNTSGSNCLTLPENIIKNALDAVILENVHTLNVVAQTFVKRWAYAKSLMNISNPPQHNIHSTTYALKERLVEFVKSSGKEIKVTQTAYRS